MQLATVGFDLKDSQHKAQETKKNPQKVIGCLSVSLPPDKTTLIRCFNIQDTEKNADFGKDRENARQFPDSGAHKQRTRKTTMSRPQDPAFDPVACLYSSARGLV